mgnify:CR=1 FL=1
MNALSTTLRKNAGITCNGGPVMKEAKIIPTEFCIGSDNPEPITVRLALGEGEDPPSITIHDEYGNIVDANVAQAKALAELIMILLKGISD